MDADCAARVRQSVGFSAYTTQRRKLWAAAAEAPEELKAMPIYCTGLKPRQLRSGRRLRLRFLEPRCWEIVKRAMAPGGTRRFAAVSGAAGRRGEDIAAGAKGCLCEILENTEGEDGICNVIVETGAACRVLNTRKEEMHRGPPLIIGELEELEEEEEGGQQDGSEDGSEDEAVVLGEEEQLELLRERVQLLELLNAAMELEQARLEQRRLELTMLLSQRRLYQELIEMRSEVADLVGLTATASAAQRPSRHWSPDETGGASDSREQVRNTNEARHRAVVAPVRDSSMPRMDESLSSLRTPSNGVAAALSPQERRSRASFGESESRTHQNSTRVEGVTRSVAEALLQRSSRAASTAEQSGQQRNRTSRSSATNSDRALTQADAVRRRGGGNELASTGGFRTGTGSAARGAQSRGGRGPVT